MAKFIEVVVPFTGLEKALLDLSASFAGLTVNEYLRGVTVEALQADAVERLEKRRGSQVCQFRRRSSDK